MEKSSKTLSESCHAELEAFVDRYAFYIHEKQLLLFAELKTNTLSEDTKKNYTEFFKNILNKHDVVIDKLILTPLTIEEGTVHFLGSKVFKQFLLFVTLGLLSVFLFIVFLTSVFSESTLDKTIFFGCFGLLILQQTRFSGQAVYKTAIEYKNFQNKLTI